MLRVLVIVLGFDGVAGQGSGTRQRYVLRVARLCIDPSIGLLPGGTRRGSVRAGRESSGAVSLITTHESCVTFGMVAPCAREDIRAPPGTRTLTPGMISRDG